MIILHPIDETWIRVECEAGIAKELSEYFTFEAQGARFMPAFRKRYWDGKIRLFKLKGHTIYKGLIPRIQEFAADRGYDVTGPGPYLHYDLPSDHCYFSNDRVEKFISTMNLPVLPRDYQIAALYECLLHQRRIILSPTGSGKSLIIYILLSMMERFPVLIVVPTINLVTQLCNDFKSYGLDADEFVHQISGGVDPQDTTGKPIYISTWQSIFDLSPQYFSQFKMVIIDEVHLAKSKSLSGLMEKCNTVPLRFGFTGTLDETQSHRLILEGLFGQVTKVASTDDLMKQKHLSPLKVKLCVLKYPEAVCKQLRHSTYPDEIDYLVTNPARDEFIAQLIKNTKGNTLVLFQYVEKHGKQLVERIRSVAGANKTIHYIDGSTSAEERERIRNAVEAGTDQVLCASYGTTSLGVNITNLHTLVLASPSKSKVRVLQSIGRALRIAAGKTHATLIDIVDDLRIGKRVNFAFQHAQARIEHYSTEKFPYTLHQFPIDQITHLQTGQDAPETTNPPQVDTDSLI